MQDDNQRDENARKKPQQQTGEEHGSIKGAQRGEDEFSGKGDTARGSGPAMRGTSGQRG